MIVTGALLAESASAVDNKLNITGGVADTYRVGSGRVAQVTLVVLTQAEPFDKAPKVDVKITDPSGNVQANQFDMPESSLGGEIGFVYFPLRIPVPVDGRYLISVSSRGGFVSLPLKIIS